MRPLALATAVIAGACGCAAPVAAAAGPTPELRAGYELYLQRTARCAQQGLDTSPAMAEVARAKTALRLGRQEEAATRLRRALAALDGCAGTAALSPAAWSGTAGPPLRAPVKLQLADAASMRAGRIAHGVVPFGQGELPRGARVQVTDGTGRALRAQARPAVTWPDGSARWLALDVVAPPGTAPVAPLVLARREDAPADEGPALEIEAPPGGGAASIATAELAVTAARGADALLVRYRRGGGLHEARLQVVVEVAGGEHPMRIDAVSVTERGPLRAVILASGAHGGREVGLRSEVDVTLEAGSPLISVAHAITNVGAGPSPRLRSCEIRVALREERNRSVRFGSARGALERPVADRDVTLTQSGRRRFRIDGAAAAEGAEAAGWATAQGGSHAFGIALRPFAHAAPVGLRVGPAGLGALLWPPDAGASLPAGVSSSHQVAIAFDPSPSRVEALVALPRPSLHASPADFARTAALQPMGLSAPGSDAYDTKVDAHFAALARHLASIDRGGKLDFGDWRLDTGEWANGEYDLAYALYLEWARRGDERYLPAAHRMAVHVRDVDVDHAPSSPSRGLPYRHGPSHRSNPFDPGHVWVQGLLVHALLADDPRSARIAREMGDALAGWVEAGDLGRTERDLGWPLVALEALREFTGSERYGRAAALLVETILRLQGPETGCWAHPIEEEAGTAGCEPFMTGVLLEGLAAYHRATGDARVADAMRRAARWLRTTAWRPAWNAFVYKEAKRFADGPRWPDLNLLIVGPLAYAACLSNDPAEKAFVDQVFRTGVRGMGARSGKQFAQQTRGVPLYLAAAQDPRCNARP